jgi:predicted membrane-bound spermidine synthase
MGMLAFFVDQYVKANALTPDSILVLFIVSVLASAWAIVTLFTYSRAKDNSRFVGLVDLLFVGAFIGGVYTLRNIKNDDCAQLTDGNSYTASFGVLGSVTYGGLGIKLNKTCSMLKACWALGIMNCIFFFITAVLAFMHKPKHRHEKVYVRNGHSDRYSHRRTSTTRSRRSSHSGRRPYV